MRRLEMMMGRLKIAPEIKQKFLTKTVFGRIKTPYKIANSTHKLVINKPEGCFIPGLIVAVETPI